MTIPTLIKLLLIRMVANNFFGLFSKRKINWSFDWLLSRSFSISAGFNEKNAVSDPEINPDKINSKIKKTIEIISAVVIPIKNCSANNNRMLGKGSKSEVSTKVILIQLLAAKLKRKTKVKQQLLKWQIIRRWINRRHLVFVGRTPWIFGFFTITPSHD